MKVITIGRSKDNNNIVIEDSKVSRSHLQIINDDNGDYYVIDLDSTNGTYVNGNRITGKVQLHKDDTIVIGYTTLSWETYFGSDDSDEDGKKPGTSNKKLYIIISSILICVFIGVIAIITYNNKKNEQYREASFDKVTQAYSEETKEANEARKKAENKANRAKIEADNAKIEKENAEKAKKNAEEQAERKVNAANKKAEDAEKAKKNAEEQAKREVNAANKKAEDAKKAKAEAEESKQLTEEFYELLSSLSSNEKKMICEILELTDKNEEALKSHFKKSDNNRKKIVIQTIKNVTNDVDSKEKNKRLQHQPNNQNKESEELTNDQ